MNVTDIAFPNLGIYLTDVIQDFSVFGFRITIYGVIMSIAILMGLFAALAEAKKTGQNPDIYWDLVIYGIFVSIVCARIYFVAFSWDTYKDHLWDIFNLRKGGIAIYGALIGAFGTVLVFSRVKKHSFWLIADTVSFGVLVGQIIGRWGNFFNREAFGGYTNNLLAMRLPIEAVRKSDLSESIVANIVTGTNYIQVHPTFLYEGLWNCLILLLLILYRKKKKFDGEFFLMYISGYGIGRFLIEGLRTDQLKLPVGGIAVSQMLGIVTAAIAILAILYHRCRLRKKD
ncbi:MAG: prolipoprotein diacylglyceryl transferase [Clostridia bacterium]|nr:prolipoprotein diacylglyceryl transferase [Clostridia bacterium]